MKIEILPTQGIRVNESLCQFGEERKVLRAKLPFDLKISDQEFEFGDFKMKQRRDIFSSDDAPRFSFFFNYDEADLLTEIEIHEAGEIKLGETSFQIGEPIDAVLAKLSPLDSDFKEGDEGVYLFPSLKISVSDSEAMGGDGNGLAYVYLSTSIEHLLG